MMPNFRNFKAVPNTMFASGALSQVPHLLDALPKKSDYRVYVIDHYFEHGDLGRRISLRDQDIVFYLDTTDEPKTATVDEYVKKIQGHRNGKLPDAVIGIGGGASLDVAKAVAIMLTNEGSTSKYQGWDLVKNNPVFKVGIPTISGTGAEVSRTAVLMGPEKKQGINSDHSIFDQIVLDPDLLATVSQKQRFYTGMDCYIHSVEALGGNFLNEFSRTFAEKALELCRKVFLEKGSDAELMVASLLGGYSIVYSEVGVCHALSYGLSYAFGLHHGEANCVAFNHLDEYYPAHTGDFRAMLKRHGIQLPAGITKGIKSDVMEKMIDITLLMEKPLCNALGDDWRQIFTRDKIRALYSKM